MRWKRCPDVLWRRTPGYLVLATVDGSTAEIDGPGGEVWELLENDIELDDLVCSLAGHFSIDDAEIRPDVSRLLERLHEGRYVDQFD